MTFIERFSRKSSVRPTVVEDGQAPLLMALEPRIMFDASVAVVAQEATQAAEPPTADSTSTEQPSQASAAADTRPSQAGQRQEVVFIDGQAANVNELVAGLGDNAEVVILDPSKDGLQQMADYLQGRQGLDAIHLLSHGADGSVQLGNVWLASNNLAEHRAALESIGAALAADGDLLLYGCKVGETGKGESFLEALASITGADVAGSADDTGAAAQGGNWTLERSSGVIETTALGAQMADYTGLLASSFSGGQNPTAPTLAVLPKMAIGDFNNDGRTDILYQVGANGTAWRFAAGNADGTFSIVDQSASPFANVTLIDAAATGTNYYAADFDNDGDTDLLAVTVTSGPAYLYRNTGSTFTRETATGFNGTQFGVRLVVGDFNGDGAADILYQPGTVDSSNAWRYALNNGNGTFTDGVQGTSPFAGLNLAPYSQFNYRVIDMDGDGDLDVMYMANNTTGTYYRNNGGTFVAVATGAFPAPVFNRSIWGDFDGDGDADLLYQVGANGTDWNYAENLGNETFQIMNRASSPFAGLTMPDFPTQNYRVGDFDGDGDLDLVGSAANVVASVFLQSGTMPKLVSASPADNSASVSPGANITLTFDQSVAKGTGNIYIVRTSDNAVIQTIAVGSSAVTGSGTTWTIDPPDDLAQGTAYAVRVDSKTFVNADGKVYMGVRDNTTLNFVTSTVQPPVISNLDGDTVTYVEHATALPIDLNGNATVTDLDSANFNGGTLTVSISSGGVSNQDVLSIISVGSGSTQIGVSGNVVSYGGNAIGTFAGGSLGNALVVTFNSGATPVAVTALLHQLSYVNSNAGDIATGNRNVQVILTDGAGGTSTVANITVGITPVNDAPTASATALAPTFTEGGSAVAVFSNTTINTVEAGQKISQITFRVLGVRNGGSERLQIDGTDVALSHGNSVTSATNGLSISVLVAGNTAFVTVDSSAGLDPATAGTLVDGVTYANDSNAPTASSRTVLLYNIRDDGGVANGGVNATNVAISGAVTLVAVNDAPTLSGGPFMLTSTDENTTLSGVRIDSVLAGLTYSDADASPLLGAAITATSGSGLWQFSLNGVTAWTNFGTLSSSASLLLTGNTFVRYVPNQANGETATFTLRAWDQTSGTASSAGIARTVNTTTNGDSTAFSSGTAMASLTVTSVNDAPVLSPSSPTLPGLSDDAVNNSGVLVSSLYASNYTDVDTGALKGIAITGQNSGNGTWQFSLDGSTWSNIGIVTPSTALLLRSSDHVRFVPNGVSGTTANLTFRAWDQTGASDGLHGIKYDASVAGNATAFSTAQDVASITVTAVNDRPLLAASSGSASWSEGDNVLSTPVAVDPGLTVTDADGPNLAQATVIVRNYTIGQDVLGFINNPATMGNISASWDISTGILTLSSADDQASLAQWQAALRSVTYNNVSDNPGTAARDIEFQVTDSVGLSAVSVIREVTVTALNDSPLITAPASIQVVEDVASVIGQISFSDVDSSSGTVTFSVASGSLAATGGAGVTVSGTSSALTLTGTLSAINAFIANNRLTYTTAANATADVALTISADTGSASTDTTVMTLTVTAQNDAPVVTVPVSISVTEDVSNVITGVSFSDADAGSGNVTATFSVPSGTLTAATASGVVVDGSGSGLLTLTGTLSDINALIAGNSLTYTTAQDADSSVTLTVTLNDNGNTGGSPQTDTKTVIITVNAVNDAPVNSVPPAQSAQQNTPLAFNTANGNAISINDVDAGGSLMIVTLSSLNGSMSLGNTTGVTMVFGNGINNTVMRLQGSQANINNVLQTLSFNPNNGFLGNASLTIQSNDQGNSGSGGAKSDSDTITINVAPVNPRVTNVSVQGLDRSVGIGGQVRVNVTFDQNVTLDTTGGTPTLLLETGLLDRNAVYTSGSGSNTLTFSYTVQAGDLSADLDFQSTGALQLNGATLTNATNDAAILTLPAPGAANSIAGQQAIVVDGVAPLVGSVSVPANGTYVAGQTLDFTVNFSEAVQVDSSGGVPRIAVTLDTGGVVFADYLAGSGGSALVFRLTAANGQNDATGIALGNSLDLNGGSITDLTGNAGAVALINVASTANVNVDAISPAVVSVALPADGSYKAGDVLTFSVTASEALLVGAQAPRLTLQVGGVTRFADYVSGNSSSTLVFQYTVQALDNDVDGIAVLGVDLRGEVLTDLAGNSMNLTLNGMGSAAGILVDTTVPTASNIVRIDATPTNSGTIGFSITFSESVSGVDLNDFGLVFSGTAAGSIASVSSLDGRTYTVLVDNLAGEGSVRLDLNAGGTGITDVAGNALNGGRVGVAYDIDRVAPSVNSVSVPANGTYVAGQSLDFTVNFSEAVQVDSSGGVPRIAVTLDTGTVFADYVSGAGSSALLFRLSVANGQLDSNGISLGNAIQLNGATLRDAVGNDVQTTLNGVAASDQVLIDAIAPSVASVSLPAPGAYNAGDVLRFTVNTSESVIVDTSSGTPRLALTLGGVTRFAQYVSGSGSSALVFEYTVQPGNNAVGGIGIGANLDLNGAEVRDAAGNRMNVTLNNTGNPSGVIIDTVAPQVSDIVRVDITPTSAGSVRYQVTFDEGVSGVDTADFTLAFTGSASGRIASVQQIDGRSYSILVTDLAGAGNVRLDLNASDTGIADQAGNAVTGGLNGSSYSIDRMAPAVTRVEVPASGTYVSGQTLDFTVRTDEAVLVDSGDGNPRLAITLDNGRVVFADYLAGSGSSALVFRLAVTNGMAGNGTFSVAPAIDLNGGSLRDARGNEAQTGLNNVGDTRGILVDARAPRPSGIVVDGPVLPTDRTLNFTLTFDEVVSGVDASDFSLLATGSASGVVQSVQQVDAQTYRISVTDLRGQGALSLSLNALGSGIRDQAGNQLAVSLVGQAQSLTAVDVGDLQYRLDPPQSTSVQMSALAQPQSVTALPTSSSLSPLAPPALFDVRSVGADLQPLGTIFLSAASSAPSFIAQVFGSSDGGIGAAQGGFGGAGVGLFGASTFAAIFSREVPGVSEMNVFNGSQWRQSDLNQGVRGVFGVPSFGQQLQQINEAEQRQVRELAQALAKSAQIGSQA